MNIVRYEDERFWFLWEKLIDSVDYNHPIFSALGLSYYKEYFFKNKKIENLSFIIQNNNTPIIGVIMSINFEDNNANLSGFGRGLNYIENNLGNIEGIKNARKFFNKEFDNILNLKNISQIFYRDYCSVDGNLSFLARRLLDMGGVPNNHFIRIIDLEREIEIIRSDLSKSCKNGVNWGRKNLEVRLFDSTNISIKNIEKLRDLHIKESGRETRSKESWETQYQMILSNKAFLIEGKFDKKVVTSYLFYLNQKVCLYASSATQRTFFDRPIGHVVMWEAICRAKTLNCKYFDTGGLVYNTQNNDVSLKQFNINRYKKSFGGNTKSQVTIQWDRTTVKDAKN